MFSKKLGSGGSNTARPSLQSINKPKTNHGASAFFAKGGQMATKQMEMRHAQTLRKLADEEQSEAEGMKCGGKVKKMARGGFVRGADGVASKGKTKAKQIGMKRGGKC